MATRIYPAAEPTAEDNVTVDVYTGHALEPGTTMGERRRIQITTRDGKCSMTLGEWHKLTAHIQEFGTANHTEPEPCRTCDGHGFIDSDQLTWNRIAKCHACNGSGMAQQPEGGTTEPAEITPEQPMWVLKGIIDNDTPNLCVLMATDHINVAHRESLRMAVAGFDDVQLYRATRVE